MRNQDTAPPSRKGGNNTRCISCKRAALYINLIQAPHCSFFINSQSCVQGLMWNVKFKSKCTPSNIDERRGTVKLDDKELFGHPKIVP